MGDVTVGLYFGLTYICWANSVLADSNLLQLWISGHSYEGDFNINEMYQVEV